MVKIKNFWDWKLLFLLGLFLVLFLPSLFEPYYYGDECTYLTLGQAFNRGLVFYRDIHDNKPPLLYLTAALTGGNLVWLKLTGLAVNLFHLGLIYELTVKLTKNKNLGRLSGLLFTAGYLIFEGRTVNAEIFMMASATLATYLIWTRLKPIKFKSGLLIGLIFSSGFLFKSPAVFDFIGIFLGLFIFTLDKINLTAIKQKLNRPPVWGIITGFTIPILLSILYYAYLGSFTPYLRSALLQNIGYLTRWQTGSSGLIWRFLILAALIGLLLVFRKKFSRRFIYFQVWFLFSLFGSLLSGRPYPHYLLQIVPSLVVLIILMIKQNKLLPRLLTIGSAGLLIFAYAFYQFWWYPILPYYQNSIRYLTGQINRQEYIEYYGSQARQDYQATKIIRRNTDPNDRIFVWGEGSCLYALSERLPAGRYVVNHHIFDFNAFDETLQAIKKNQPKIIVKQQREQRNWPELEIYLDKNYRRFYYPSLEDEIYFEKQK